MELDKRQIPDAKISHFFSNKNLQTSNSFKEFTNQ